jgi:hypothetical protein
VGGAVSLWHGDHPVLVVLALNFTPHGCVTKPQQANENRSHRFLPRAGLSIFPWGDRIGLTPQAMVCRLRRFLDSRVAQW